MDKDALVAEEQQVLLRAVKALDEDFQRWKDLDPASGADRSAQRTLLKQRDERLSRIRDVGNSIIFGRILIESADKTEDVHIGSYPLDFDGHEIAEWRAPIAKAFYQPSHTEHGQLLERRSIQVDGETVKNVSVDSFGKGRNKSSGAQVVERSSEPGSSAARRKTQNEMPQVVRSIRGEDAVLESLARSRDGKMQQVVATIQEDQHRAMEADSSVALFIEGGPGTGKTVVGLHRLAVILYEQALGGLSRDALVIGPNKRFMEYVANVLPSLGENAVEMTDVSSICTSEIPPKIVSRLKIGPDRDPFVERVKGDLLMIPLLREAAWTAGVGFDLTLVSEEGRASVDVEEIDRILSSLKARFSEGAISLADARTALGQRLYEVTRESMRRSRDATAIAQARRRDDREIEGASSGRNRKIPPPQNGDKGDQGGLTNDDSLDVSPRSAATLLPREFKVRSGDIRLISVVDELLPMLTAPEVVSRALSGGSSLDSDSPVASALLKKYVFGDHEFNLKWVTSADLALLAVAEHLLNGTVRRYGHVVVDEAQDISPVMWTVIRNRTSSGAITVLGDLNQRTRPGACGSWEDAATALDLKKWNQVTLDLSYRVPKPILDFAKRALPMGSRTTAPVGLREGDEPVVKNLGHPPTLADLDAVLGIAEEKDLVGVITNDPALLGVVRDRTVFIEPDQAKGLEFDSVAVVEPALWFDGTDEAKRLLYIALSRSTKNLAIIHYLPLPDVLRTDVDD